MTIHIFFSDLIKEDGVTLNIQASVYYVRHKIEKKKQDNYLLIRKNIFLTLQSIKYFIYAIYTGCE